MAKEKEIEITINEDGTLSIDQIGFDGKECVGQVNELLEALGKEVKKDRKPEYYKKEKVNVHQRRT